MTEPATDPARSPSGSGSARSPRLLVGGAAAVTVVLWASAFIGIRGAGRYFDPGAMALLRMAVGTLGLGAYAWWRGIRLPPRRSVPLLAAWGIGWFCVYNVALNTAERLVDAGTAAMIVNLAPLMVVVLGGLLLHEGFPRGLVVGAPISFAGVVLIGVESSSGRVGVEGLLLALLSAVLYAGCTLVQKHLLRTVDAATLTWLGAAAGTVALLPWSARLVDDLGSAPVGAVWQVVYLGIFPTAVAFTTWAYVLSRVSAGRTAATTYVVPAVALLMSWALLREAPSPLELAGGVLCLVGVFVTRAGARVARPARSGRSARMSDR